ncbi:DUF1543 domain-containing protein [Pedobacter sp. LMG 31464]|uniref:DUF1543 domain-containing protein n=1 Tax=Pedobacter planticolens TaxID=2679964 RepID=A0A923IW19_9SPHI|nr:DUF1543 domain-containing protein [Pedobacter planticolens]MBB2146458.1 DUF1543 domain-containing protein [Pedobacter planticolens]
MQAPQLFMILLGCRPEGRHTEQHDIFFGIGTSLKELMPEMNAFWPEAKGKIHVDAWRIVNKVDGYKVEVVAKNEEVKSDLNSLFFLNLGGYKKDEFDELHYKMLVVSDQKALAIKQAKETAFYKHTAFEGATSHIDDKFGVDVDDIFEIQDILSSETKSKYALKFTSNIDLSEDEIFLGYLPLSKI